jgi:DNA invertase Pin-like site-specific DNA recombinase
VFFPYISQIYMFCFRTLSTKRADLYLRVSTLDQHPETQLYDPRQMASQRDYQIVDEFTDTISGARQIGRRLSLSTATPSCGTGSEDRA